MDIRNWGQTFMARIKQLPSQAGQLASNLPESLGNLPDKAQAALQNLPQSLEDGAKAVLANEQVAEGWKLVGQGVGELTGFQPGDHIEISPSAKDPAGNILKDPAVKVPKGKIATPKDPIGNAIKDASTTAKKPPVPVEPAPVVPAENPLPSVIRNAANETPAAPVTRTVKTTTRVAKGATRVKPPVPEVPIAPEVPVVPVQPSPASQVLTNGARVPVKVKDLKGAGEFTDVSKRLTQKANLLEQVGHPEEAQSLRALSDRMKRARELYQEGNTPAAFRMVHAKNKLGFANPEIQGALETSNKAEEVMAAFGKQASPEALRGATEFSEAAERLASRAEVLTQMGRPEEAKTLSDMASRMTRASELYKEGNTPAAFRMLHAERKIGLANPEVQEALRVSNKAEELAAAFGGEGATAAKTVQASGEVAETAAQASKTVATESGTVAKTVTRSAKASRAAEAVESTGRTASSSARVAEGVKSSKAAKAATEVVETTETAAQASKGAAAASEVAETAASVTEAAEAGKGVKAAAEVAKDVTTAAEAGGGAANGLMNGAKGILGKAKGMFSKLGESVKGFFGKIGKGAGNSGGWQTIKQGFAKMLPGLGKAFKSSAIFSAVFSVAENLFFMLKGERTWRKALGNVFGDTLGGAVGGVVSALASGGAIAALGALGVVGWPLTLAAGAVGILGYFAFDRMFRNTGIYDTITHLFT